MGNTNLLLTVGAVVKSSVSMVDRGSCDSANIVGVVMHGAGCLAELLSL